MHFSGKTHLLKSPVFGENLWLNSLISLSDHCSFWPHCFYTASLGELYVLTLVKSSNLNFTPNCLQKDFSSKVWSLDSYPDLLSMLLDFCQLLFRFVGLRFSKKSGWSLKKHTKLITKIDLSEVNSTYLETSRRAELSENQDGKKYVPSVVSYLLAQIEATFEEAHSITTNGDRLRHIFVTLLVHSMPADPSALWEKYKDYLAEDYIHKLKKKYEEEKKELTEIPDDIYNTVLLKLRSLLEEHGKDLKDFGLPEAHGVLEDEREPLALREEVDYVHEDLAIEAANEEDELNDGQRRLYEEVLAAVENEISVLFALDAPGMC